MGSNEMVKETLASLLEGMESYLSTKTVVGEPIEIGDTIILPLVNVSFGMGAGTMRGKENVNNCGGMGGKMTPSAVIVIKNNSSRVINISTNTGLEKLIDMIPDFVDTFKNHQASKNQDKTARKKAKEAMEDMLFDSDEEEEASNLENNNE